MFGAVKRKLRDFDFKKGEFTKGKKVQEMYQKFAF